MRTKFLAAVVVSTLVLPSWAQDVTYRKDIQPMLKAMCTDCHGDKSPSLAEFKRDEEKYRKAQEGPRVDTYEHLLALIAYPDTGAFMRRLDDGSSTPDKKPGNMYKHLGETDAARSANLKTIKAWVGEGAWNLNRWSKRGDVPAITKEQLEKLRLKY